MRFYLSRKIGPWRIGSSFKFTWWNFLFLFMAAMVWVSVWLAILLLEAIVLLYYYIFKGLFIAVRFLWRKTVNLFQFIVNEIKAKTAGP